MKASSWLFLLLYALAGACIAGFAAVQGARAAGLENDWGFQFVPYLFGGTAIALPISGLIAWLCVKRLGPSAACIATLIVPAILLFVAGFALQKNGALPPSIRIELFKSHPARIEMEDLPKYFPPPLTPPGLLLNGFNFSGRDSTLIFRAQIRRNPPALRESYLDSLRQHYRAQGFEVTDLPGLEKTPFLLQDIDPVWNPAQPFALPWWQPGALPNPQTLKISKPDEGWWIWSSAESSDIYFFYWDS